MVSRTVLYLSFYRLFLKLYGSATHIDFIKNFATHYFFKFFLIEIIRMYACSSCAGLPQKKQYENNEIMMTEKIIYLLKQFLPKI